MLSYQHEYHAGNHADVLKHWLLVECLLYLQEKDNPFDYIDTHAGSGSYQLDSKLALKNAEFMGGIERLLEQPVAGMENYLDRIQTSVKARRYPGSPALVNELLRPDDRSWLFELHPQTFTKLHRQCQRKGRTQVRKQDGFQGLLGLLPVASRRALVLIDPAYEVKDDYDTVIKVLTQAWKKMPQAIFLLWYPVIDMQRVSKLEQALRASIIRDVHLIELGVREPAMNTGMTGSGMIVVNPPWTLQARVDAILPVLSETLSEDGSSRCRRLCLVPE